MPVTTEYEDCTDCCEGDVEPFCCEAVEEPNTLSITFSGPGGCCIDGTVMTMTKSGTGFWNGGGVAATCPGSTSVGGSLICSDSFADKWNLSGSFSAAPTAGTFGTVSVESVSCDPFEVVINMAAGGGPTGCPSQPFTATVTL